MAIIDSFESETNANQIVRGVDWSGQTFTASQSYDVTTVSFIPYTLGSPAGDYTVAIRATSGGLPTGPNLAEVTVNANTLVSMEWNDFTFDAPASLTEGVLYAIIMYWPSGAGTDYTYLRNVNGNPYAGGERLRSTNSGSSWTSLSTNDAPFRTHDSIPVVGQAENPKPATLSSGWSPKIKQVSWDAVDDAVGYNVYFGKTGEMVKVSDAQTELFWLIPAELEYEEEYSWRVDTVLEESTVEGDVWTFTIGAPAARRRLIPFVYSAEIAYLVEMGAGYMRFYYDDELVASVETPYTETQNFKADYLQLADVMRVVEKNHNVHKISRVSPTEFKLESIPFKRGPFLLRNDILDIFNVDPASLSCDVLETGQTGTLTANADVFEDGHVGALFKLIHPKPTMQVERTGTGNSGELDVQGGWRFITEGSWAGTIKIQRNENNNGWEDFRTFKVIQSGSRNISENGIEDVDNVKMRLVASISGGNFSATLTLTDLLHEGIVRITKVTSSTEAECEVVSPLVSTAATKRWAEGAWSNVRGYPTAIAFFEDRCNYAGGI